MAAILFFTGLVSIFMVTYVANHRVKAPIEAAHEGACHSCSNHSCSQYRGGE